MPRVSDMAKTCVYAAFIVCIGTVTCHAYRLVGSEALSDALVAHHYTINANLDAVIVVDPTVPTFEYQTFYAMGYADEPEHEQGKLHFLEHIIGGVGSYPPGGLAELIGSSGGKYHAAIGIHMTYFTMRFPSDKLALAVEIDRDRFYSTLFDKEFVDKERQAVLTEISGESTSSSRRFSRYFGGLLYGMDNLDGLGTPGFVEKIEPGDLKQLFHNVLRRKRRLVVVIGDVDLEDVLTKLAEAYRSGNNRTDETSPEPRFPNPDVLGERYDVKYESLNKSRFKKAWRIPGLGHPDYASFLVLAAILVRPSNSLRSSLLDSQIVNTFSVWTASYKGFGLIACNAVLPAVTSMSAIEVAIEKEIQRVKSHGVTEDEFSAALNRRLRSLYSEFYNRSDMAYRFGQAFALAGDPLLYPRIFSQIRRVRVNDIPRIVREHLVEDNSITLSWTIKEPLLTSTDFFVIAIVLFGCGGTLFAIIRAVRKQTQEPI